MTRTSATTATSDDRDADTTARPAATQGAHTSARRTTLKETAVTISGGFAVAAVALQWLVPICFGC